MQQLRTQFQVGNTEKGQFSYIGLQIEQSHSGITIKQDSFSQKVQSMQSVDDVLSEQGSQLSTADRKKFRSIVGQLNWAARQTRPDLIFDVLELSMKFNNSTGADMNRARKVTKRLASLEVPVLFPSLGIMKSWYLLVMCDAGFANLSDRVSSGGGLVIFLVGSNGKCCPIVWKSNKIKRIVRSTLAAETLILNEAVEYAIYVRAVAKEILRHEADLPIELWTDNRNAFRAASSVTQVEDKQLRIDMASIKETIEEESIVLKWCPGEEMLADCLSKCGACSRKLLNVFVKGSIAGHFKENRFTGLF